MQGGRQVVGVDLVHGEAAPIIFNYELARRGFDPKQHGISREVV